MIYEKRYDNGLRLVVKRMPGILSVTMGILVGTGASVESAQEDGISHFIEHMQFKGTTKRNAFEISDAFDKIGAQVNAFTGKDCTCYYAKSINDHTAEAFEALADLFLNATYPEEEIEREKGVICEEISMNEDTPEDLCLDLLASAYYGKENYGRNILGPAKNVKGFTMEQVNAYKAERYCPENIVISFAGGITFEEADGLVSEYFSSMKKVDFKPRKIQPVLKGKSLVKKKPIEQLHLAIGYQAIARGDDSAESMQIVNTVLGGGMSSRLFQEVREKNGLAYSVYSYLSSYEECGSLVIYAGVNAENGEKAYDAIGKVVKDLRKNGISEEEFMRGRAQMKSSLLFAQENTSSQMLTYGKYMLFNDKLFDFDQKIEKINAITQEDIRLAIEKTFDESKKAVAAVGVIDKPFVL
ncbi:MAG: insulinase family protein [Clostridia bacterium]|nr:insulinase family protein [Clostridia bacterium]